MQRRPYHKKGVPDTLICTNPKCTNISSKLYIVEDKVIEALKIWLANYKLDYTIKDTTIEDKNQILKHSTLSIEKEIEKEKDKLNKLYDFLENGIYSSEEFVSRSKTIKETIHSLEERLKENSTLLQNRQKSQSEKNSIIPKLENVINLYDKLETAEDKNILLKSILAKVTYLKTEKAIKHNSDPTNFELNLYPKLPKI